MTTTTPTTQRLYSLDALRGFDMFWIMGAEAVIHSLATATKSPIFEAAAQQLTHPDWHGFTLYDTIFPLFLFLAGVATPYSVGRDLENGKPRRELLLRVIRRGLILVLLGIIYNNGLVLKPLAEIRFPSVLGRIGLAYMFANIIYLYTKQMGQIIWFVALLIGYWLLLAFNSAPGFPMGDMTMEGNFASYLDRLIVPGHLYKDIHDPEGLISCIPAIGTALLGIYCGNLLKHGTMSGARKALQFLIMGVVSLILAQTWNLVFPINKNLWTSSFVLQAGGVSLLLLSLFYYVIDVLGYRRWAFFFAIIGMNSILIYMSDGFIDWAFTAQALFTWLMQLFSEPYATVVLALMVLLIKWGFLYFMYLKKVFLRV